MQPTVQSLDHLVLTVADIPTTCAFYRDVLGMKPEPFTPASGGTRWAIRFGAQKINLHQSGSEFDPKAKTPTPGSADLCFLSDTPLATWRDHLEARNIPIEAGPVPRTGASGPILSLYIRDPDDNLIEIANSA